MEVDRTATTTCMPQRRKEKPPPLALIRFHPTLEHVPIGEGEIVLGRDAGAGVRLDGRGDSRSHALLSRRGDRVHVRDLGSRNGTFMNGEPVGSDGRELAEGAILRCGQTLFVLRRRHPFEACHEWIDPPDGMVGPVGLEDLRQRIDEVGRSPDTVLIQGETGTGKHLVAEAIHEAGRAVGPFVHVNVAAIPPTLFESELFGSVRGGFSGAVDRPGLVEQADAGLLFIDEIGALSPELYPRLLTVIEHGACYRVGSRDPVPVRARFVVATSADLSQRVAEGTFPLDLLGRLSLVVEVPPLRARVEDLPSLLGCFLELAGPEALYGLDARVVERLALPRWPGNVRVLGAVVKSARDHDGRLDEVRLERALWERRSLVDGEPEVSGLGSPEVLADPAGPRTPTRDQVLAALRVERGNVTRAAKELGVNRSTMYLWFKKHGIGRGDRGGEDS